MKAAQFSRFGGPEVVGIVDLPDPRPVAGEIRIKVRAAGVNASDWKKRQGLMDQNLPQTLGYEAAGIVDMVGPQVTGVTLGDQVFGASPYGAAQAELAVLSFWAPIPEVTRLRRGGRDPGRGRDRSPSARRAGRRGGQHRADQRGVGQRRQCGGPDSPSTVVPASSARVVRLRMTPCARSEPSRWPTAKAWSSEYWHWRRQESTLPST